MAEVAEVEVGTAVGAGRAVAEPMVAAAAVGAGTAAGTATGTERFFGAVGRIPLPCRSEAQ